MDEYDKFEGVSKPMLISRMDYLKYEEDKELEIMRDKRDKDIRFVKDTYNKKMEALKRVHNIERAKMIEQLNKMENETFK